MSDAVIVALISGGLTLIGTALTVILSHRSTLAEMDKKNTVADEAIKGELNVIRTEIKTLSNRVEAHNKVVERTYALEQRCAVLDEKVKVANNRIKDLEGGKMDD